MEQVPTASKPTPGVDVNCREKKRCSEAFGPDGERLRDRFAAAYRTADRPGSRYPREAMARLLVAAFYVALGVTLGALYTWDWVIVIAFGVVVPWLAITYGLARGGEFITELSRRRWEPGGRYF
jgi:Flp pilus assembly protein TadB